MPGIYSQSRPNIARKWANVGALGLVAVDGLLETPIARSRLRGGNVRHNLLGNSSGHTLGKALGMASRAASNDSWTSAEFLDSEVTPSVSSSKTFWTRGEAIAPGQVRRLTDCEGDWGSFSACSGASSEILSAYPTIRCTRQKAYKVTVPANGSGASCPAVDAQTILEECLTTPACPAPMESAPATTAAPSGDNSSAGEANVGAVTSSVDVAKLASATAKTCKVPKASADLTVFESFKGFRGSQTIGDEIAKANAGGTKTDFLMYGAMAIGIGPPTVAVAGLLPLVLVLWLFGCCKVCCRRCRRCCRCCRERKEIAQIRRCKKLLIILGSLVGYGGLIALSQGGFLGATDGGSAAAADAGCAASKFVEVSLNGGTGATTSSRRLASADFLGFGPALVEVNALSTQLSAATTTAAAALAADDGLLAALNEAELVLHHVLDTLNPQALANGISCPFCQTCCGGTNSLVQVMLSDMQTGLPNKFRELRSDLMPGGKLESAKVALDGSNASLSELYTSVEVGPAGQIINNESFFDGLGYLSYAALAFLGVQGGAALGLLAMLYGLKCCCCFRKCRFGRKDHPAPQCPALGWCTGCLGAVLGLGVGALCYIIGGVSGELCMFMDELGLEAGVQEFGSGLGLSQPAAKIGFMTCFGANIAGQRDLYGDLGLQEPLSSVAVVESDLDSIMAGSFDSLMAKYNNLVAQADAQASSLSAPDGTMFDCSSIDFQARISGHTRGLMTLDSYECSRNEFVDHQKDLARSARDHGVALKDALTRLQSHSQWMSLDSSLASVQGGASSTLQDGLMCGGVYAQWTMLHDQVCGGLVTAYWGAGQVWALMGVLALIGSIAQYKLWRHLKDNRSLYFDNHPDKRLKGCRRLCGMCCACGVGDGDDEEGTEAAEEEEEPEGTKGGRCRKFCCCCCCCRRRRKTDDEDTVAATPKKPAASKKSKAKGGDGAAAEKIAAKALGAFDITVEEGVRSFLEKELYSEYKPAFVAAASAERVASWKVFERERKTKKDKEVQCPDQPEMDPSTFFEEGEYTNFDPDGIPQADAEGKALDKKTLVRLKKDYALVKKNWDKYVEEKHKYEAWQLYQARREVLEVDAEVIYPEEIDHLRPISKLTNKPMKVTLARVPDDPGKAVWTDEIKPITGTVIDGKIRKDKNLAKKFKGLPDRCLDAVKDDMMTRLMTLSKSDASIWDGVVPSTKQEKPTKGKGKKEPKPPKEPKGLVEPKQLFQVGKAADKYSDYDDDGIPTTKADGKEVTEKERKGLQKQWEAAKKAWDKHQAALEKYNEELAKFKGESGETGEPQAEDSTDGGIPTEQKERACAAAAPLVISQLVQKLIAEYGEELATEVNQGDHDPADLQAVLVRETWAEDEVITDPVLKAFRRFDENRTNFCNAADLGGFFSALQEDELQTDTHRFYGDISEEEIEWLQGALPDDIVSEAKVSYDGLKAFIESQDVALDAGKSASSLANSLLTLRINSCFSDGEVSDFCSPRSWRRKFAGGEAKGKGETKEKTEETAAAEDADKKAKKDKKTKNDTEEAAATKSEPKKDKDKKDKKDKKEVKEVKEEAPEDDGAKKKEKKDKKDKKK